jgi:hypothetical protein
MPFETHTETADDDAPLDPLSDLLFGLVAIVIPAVALMLPLIRMAADSVPARDGQASVSFASGELTFEGGVGASFFATGEGLRIPGEGNRTVQVDRLLDDRQLAALLRRLKERSEALLLLIEPEGQETAFLFEAVAAVHGPPRMLQVRLDPACAFVRNPDLFRQCVAGTVVRGKRP